MDSPYDVLDKVCVVRARLCWKTDFIDKNTLVPPFLVGLVTFC